MHRPQSDLDADTIEYIATLAAAFGFICILVMVFAFTLLSLNNRGAETIAPESLGFNSYHELSFSRNMIASTYGGRYVFDGSNDHSIYESQGCGFHLSFSENDKIISVAFERDATSVSIDKSATKSIAMITLKDGCTYNNIANSVRNNGSLTIVLCPNDVSSFNSKIYNERC